MVIQFALDRLENCNKHDHYMPWFYQFIVGYGIGIVTILAALVSLVHFWLIKRKN